MTQVDAYISTTRPDYRHAKALVASIEAHAPGTRIFILPDDDYRGDAMFGHPVWRPSDPRVLALDRFYKKIRVFWGPAERFMFFDADQLVVRPLKPLLDLLSGFPAPFFAPNLSSRVHGEWTSGTDAQRERIFRERAGRPDVIARFDPGYRWMERFPFNSGEFAASRDAIDREELLSVFERACAFHRAQDPRDPLVGSRSALFMSDQGFLNYYMARYRPGLPLHWIKDLHRWGGHAEARRRPRDGDPAFEGSIIHWAGCPRPGPLPLEPWVPRHVDWLRRYLGYCIRHRDWPGLLRDASDHSIGVFSSRASALRRRFRR